VEVSIPADAWDWQVQEFQDDILRSLRFPQLKSLTGVLTQNVGILLEDFLKHHPKLEELDVAIIDDTCVQDGEEDMWDGIRAHCNADGAYHLKKLHWKMWRHFWINFDVSEVLDWGFLEGMEALEDFKVDICYDAGYDNWEHSLGIGPRLLECLRRNPNRKLERLSLNGIHVGGSFWARRTVSVNEGEYCAYYQPDGDVNDSEEVPLESKLDLLGGFQNLKRLSFRHSANAVDDDVMQFIFREMTALEELEVSHCEHLTDVGIAGTGPEEKRVSIRSLKGQS